MNFYNVNDVYSETFFQLPKVLFTNSKYIKLSNDAKVAYALLKDRFNFSVRNHWIDEDGNIYFIFTNDELMTILHCGKNKVVTVKKELEKANLLYQKRMGYSPIEKRNIPNRLYLLRPEVTQNDVYLQNMPTFIVNMQQEQNANAEFLDTSRSLKNKLPQNRMKSGSLKNKLPLQNAESLNTSGSLKNKLPLQKRKFEKRTISRIINKDTIKDTIKDTSELDKYLLNYNKDILSNQENIFLNEDSIKLLSMWADTPKDVYHLISLILNAKHTIEKEWGHHIIINDTYLFIEWQEKIKKTIRSVFNAIRTGKKINNFDNYFYGSFRKLFAEYPFWIVNRFITEDSETKDINDLFQYLNMNDQLEIFANSSKLTNQDNNYQSLADYIKFLETIK